MLDCGPRGFSRGWKCKLFMSQTPIFKVLVNKIKLMWGHSEGPQKCIKRPRQAQTGKLHLALESSFPRGTLQTHRVTHLLSNLSKSTVLTYLKLPILAQYFYDFLKYLFLFIYLVVLGLNCGMWDLVPRPEAEPGFPALSARNWTTRELSHWTTRELP